MKYFILLLSPPLIDDSAMFENRIWFILDHAFDATYHNVYRIWLDSWTTATLLCALRYGMSDLQVPFTLSYDQVIVRLTECTECLGQAVAGMMRV